MQIIYDQIWSAGLKILEIRINSKKELIQKLSLKFPQAEALILKVIEEMERVHLVSDSRFTEEYVAHLTQKNIGRLKIMRETQQKGLPADLVEQALLNQEWSEEGQAKRAIQEKERALQNLEARKKKQKLLSFLRNRGFTERVVYSLLKDYGLRSMD